MYKQFMTDLIIGDSLDLIFEIIKLSPVSIQGIEFSSDSLGTRALVNDSGTNDWHLVFSSAETAEFNPGQFYYNICVVLAGGERSVLYYHNILNVLPKKNIINEGE